MAYKLIIFDWDGTLMDSQGKIVSCMQQAAQLCDVDVPSVDAVKHIIGISLLPAIKQLFGFSDTPGEQQKAEQVRDAYKHVFIEMDQTPSPLFDGVHTMLTHLVDEGHELAVATGKARRGLERAWSQSGTKSFFVNSRCADEAQSKPSPDMLEQLLADHSLTPDQAVMIGDTAYDMKMAKDIGMERIAVTYGVHDVALLASQQPTFTVDSVSQLHHTLLTRLNNA